MVNPRFTDGGTLHGLCFTSPEHARESSKAVWEPPAKIQKRPERRLAQQKRSAGCLKMLETAWEPLKQFRNGLGATRKGSETTPSGNGPERPKRAPSLSVYDFGPPDFVLVLR